uniref:Uncharacterized protein n=1 Tax=Vespula pensylvanica TaxID=30213 RepID=A0A834PGN5_VESPE|nr:hypothetical protein H0235_001808 [Vespula pensylvanica]
MSKPSMMDRRTRTFGPSQRDFYVTLDETVRDACFARMHSSELVPRGFGPCEDEDIKIEILWAEIKRMRWKKKETRNEEEEVEVEVEEEDDGSEEKKGGE